MTVGISGNTTRGLAYDVTDTAVTDCALFVSPMYIHVLLLCCVPAVQSILMLAINAVVIAYFGCVISFMLFYFGVLV